MGRPRETVWGSPTKVCKGCSTEKERAAFNTRSDGDLQAWCKDCCREAARVSMAKKRAADPSYNATLHARHKVKRRAYSKAWATANMHICVERVAKRRALQRKAFPAWADRDTIKSLYQLAATYSAALGVEFHVDHIVPLDSPLVCGLHCESNLQILDKSTNSKKSNRFWPDMP